MPNKFIFHTFVSQLFACVSFNFIQHQANRMRYRWFVMILATLCLLPRAQAEASEPTLKAEFAYGCALYTDWSALPRRAGLNVCTNSHFLYPELNKLIGKSVKGRMIETRLLSQSNNNWQNCNLLVVDNSEPGYWERMKQQGILGTANMLTIVDNSVANHEGAIVTFGMGNNRVVFDVDQEAARSAGITLSSTFLYLARTVR